MREGQGYPCKRHDMMMMIGVACGVIALIPLGKV